MSQKTKPSIKQNWDNATWEGSRRAMLRQSLKLSIRERLEALEELCNTSNKIASSVKSKKNKLT